MIRVLALALAPALLAVAPAAQAAATRTTEVARHGFVEASGGTGCSQTQVVAPVTNAGLVRVEPDEGDSVGIDAEVLAVEADGGEVRWRIGPSAATCAGNDAIFGAGEWSWSTWDDAAWSVVFRREAYAVTASSLGGIASIAGFRVRAGRRGPAPTVGRARRALGRPSSVRRGRGSARVVCTVRWRRLGLEVRFVNFGLAPPCRHGLLQAATIEGQAASGWVARVGRAPAVVTGTSLGWLEQQAVGSTDDFGRRSWTLAEVYFPVGSPGFVPAVSALFTGSGRLRAQDRVRGFELWVGAGGD